VGKMKSILKKNKLKVANIGFVILFALFLTLVIVFQFDIQFLANGFQSLSQNSLQVYFLDVGQASSTLVILPTGRTLLVDCGSEESEDEFLKSVKKILKQNKLSQIDMLLLTHSDEDHVGGAVKLFENFQVNALYRPKVLSSSHYEKPNEDFKIVDSYIFSKVISAAYKEPNCKIEFIEDKIFLEKDCVVEIFSCKQDTYKDTNSYSPFVTVSYQRKVFMFCGDAPKERESELLSDLKAENRKLEVDFLLVSHHGAKNASSEEFLSYIRPKAAVVSAGDDLHPTQTVIDRLIESGVEDIYCTKTDGSIAVGIKDSGVFMVKTMSRFVDLPLLVCIIFVIGESWYFYFVQKRKIRKFS